MRIDQPIMALSTPLTSAQRNALWAASAMPKNFVRGWQAFCDNRINEMRRMRERRFDAHCSECGFRLTGTVTHSQNHAPDCGHEFTPLLRDLRGEEIGAFGTASYMRFALSIKSAAHSFRNIAQRWVTDLIRAGLIIDRVHHPIQNRGENEIKRSRKATTNRYHWKRIFPLLRFPAGSPSRHSRPNWHDAPQTTTAASNAKAKHLLIKQFRCAAPYQNQHLRRSIIGRTKR